MGHYKLMLKKKNTVLKCKHTESYWLIDGTLTVALRGSMPTEDARGS